MMVMVIKVKAVAAIGKTTGKPCQWHWQDFTVHLKLKVTHVTADETPVLNEETAKL